MGPSCVPEPNGFGTYRPQSLHPPRLKEHPSQLHHGYGSPLAIFVAVEAQTSGKLKSSAGWPVYGEQLKSHRAASRIALLVPDSV
jgi:hypothetical protein